MRIHIANGTVTGSNQRFASDPVAEVFITAAGQRTFREPGIVYPGIPGLPLWDGNPEVFEMDPDRLGLATTAIPAGANFEASGVLGFEFGDYELWPADLTLKNIPDFPTPVRSRESNEITIGSLNIERLMVNEDIYSNRLVKLSKYIRIAMQAPDILGIQEVGGKAELNALAAQISADNPAIKYTGYFIGSNQNSDIFLAFLVRTGISITGLIELGAFETYTFAGRTKLLHDRAPLKLRATLPWGKPVTVLNVHLRSLRKIEDSAEGPRVRYKRDKAATSIANMVQTLQNSDTDGNLVVLGDFNAFQFSDGYVDVLGQITGDPASSSGAMIAGTDIVNPNLINHVLSVPKDKRYSFNYRGNAQVLDHILSSVKLDPYVSGTEFARGNSDAAEEYRYDDPPTVHFSSDHDGIVLFISQSAKPPIALESFTATTLNGLIRLMWTTTRESSISGYNIYKSTSETENYSQLNPTLIPALGDAGTRVTYSFEDHAGIPGQTYYYQLESISLNGNSYIYGPVNADFILVSVSEQFDFQGNFALMQNFPNPFNPKTTIEFALPRRSDVSVKIFNVLGIEVRMLADRQNFPPGINTIVWDGRDNQGRELNSGVFYVRLKAQEFTGMRKMILIR